MPASSSDSAVSKWSVPLAAGHQTTAIRYASAEQSIRVVMAHGAGVGQQHPFMSGIARRLGEAGIDVWTFNFLYMEQKRGAPDKPPALEDCFRRVVAFARDASGMPGALFVGGKSMGGRIATHLAAQGDQLNGVFALGYPLHPPGKPEQLRSAHLPAITVPVLIVQGERDAFGTPSELTPVIAAMKANVTLQIVPGGDHSLGVRGQAQDQLYDWLSDLIAKWANRIGVPVS